MPSGIVRAKAPKTQPLQRGRSTHAVDRIEAMLTAAGRLDGTRAFVAASHGLDLLCALIRHGCQSATCLKPGVRGGRGEHDLVLVPDIEGAAAADEAIRTAHCALAPSGRVVMGVAGDALGLSRRLRLNGFRSVRTRVFSGYTIVTAEAGRIA
jgi:hypothetical protein